jgi:hypothetical protein
MTRITVSVFAVAALLAVPCLADTTWRTESQTSSALASNGQYAQALQHALLALQKATQSGATDDAKVAILDQIAHLYYLQGNDKQSVSYARQVVAIRSATPDDKPALAASQEDLAQLLDLQGDTAEAEPLHKAASTNLGIAVMGTGSPTSALGRPWGPLLESVYDFYDTSAGETGGYGRYTYVVVLDRSARSRAMLSAATTEIRHFAVEPPDRAVANLFELPVTPAMTAKLRNEAAADSTGLVNDALTAYDVNTAGNLITAACAEYKSVMTMNCLSVSRGPYLIVFTRPVGKREVPQRPYFIIDLSTIGDQAFPFFVRKIQGDIQSGSLTDDDRVLQAYALVLTITLNASDWIGLVMPSLKSIVEVVK